MRMQSTKILSANLISHAHGLVDKICMLITQDMQNTFIEMTGNVHTIIYCY